MIPELKMSELSECPNCLSDRMTTAYSGLPDRLFGSVSGTFGLALCISCGCLFQNPQITPSSLPLAYERYFTHDSPQRSDERRTSLARALVHLAINDYKNKRFGGNQRGVHGGRFLVSALPRLRTSIDRSLYHLPKIQQGKRELLDVGCGNGGFLARARNLGWNCRGCDFDPKAVEASKSLDLEVRLGGPETWADHNNFFDILTLSHVIEHVHNPRELLANCFALLKPGGLLYVETPNSNSISHQIYKENWVGLDPPRHLVIFNRSNLSALLNSSGYTVLSQIKSKGRHPSFEGQNKRLFQGSGPSRGDKVKTARGKTFAAIPRLRPSLNRGEVLTFWATKSSES